MKLTHQFVLEQLLQEILRFYKIDDLLVLHYWEQLLTKQFYSPLVHLNVLKYKCLARQDDDHF